jgi:uncharacterized protein YdeI (YjbR/CyaY-like superfamily)
MELKNNIKAFRATTRAAWRKWLMQNHAKEKSLWLIIYKKDSGVPTVTYSEAVDEALCFGWIDSKPNKRDDKSYYQFFSIRNPKSKWSKVNKLKIAALQKQGLIASAGKAAIALAKKTGTWDALNDVDEIVIPDDLKKALQKNKIAESYFEAFPRSVKRGILEWVLNAKQQSTRDKRITETVTLAAKNIRANQYNPPK